MNIAIVDDSASDRRHLEQILQKYAAINQLDMNIEHFFRRRSLSEPLSAVSIYHYLSGHFYERDHRDKDR